VNPGLAGAPTPSPGHRRRHLPACAIAGITAAGIVIVIGISCCCFRRTGVDLDPPPVRRVDVIVEMPPVHVRG
jgi:hypothetical protein